MNFNWNKNKQRYKGEKEDGEVDIVKMAIKTGIIGIVVFAVMFFVVLIAFSQKEGNKNYKYNKDDEINLETESGKKANVLGIIQKIDLTKNEIEVTDLQNSDRPNLTLKLVGYTEIKDKDDELLVAAEIEMGSVAEIQYAEESKKAENIKISDKVWEKKNILGITVDEDKNTITVGDETYNYSSKLIKTYKGEKIVFGDINKDTVVTLKGYDDNIWAIIVQKYYGYLAFSNHENLVGADVEVDTKIFKKIETENKISLSPGEHKIVVKRDDIETQTRYIIIKEKETTTVDLGDIDLSEGTINFNINTEGYTINLVNKDKTYNEDFSGRQVEIPYGTYAMTISKEGYRTITKEIQIKTPTTNIKVDMKKLADTSNTDTNTNTSTNTSNGSTSTNSQTGSNTSTPTSGKVKITSNVVKSEVYIDDKYIGVTPMNTTLSVGTHKIAVRSQGYIPNVKQVYVSGEGQTVDFSLDIDDPYANPSNDLSGDVYVD